MESYCRNCHHPFHKTMLEYYKPIMSQGFPVCIRCNVCVDCCDYSCNCTRCRDCLEVIDICRCDNDPMQYSNSDNFESSFNQMNNQMNNLIDQFSYLHLRDTPYIEEVFDDMMDIE